MPLPIEDYALISDCHTGALVGRDGSIDWLCLPRYDSASAFGALLGSEDHGRWLLAPEDPKATNTRRYQDDTLMLVTEWVTPTGAVQVTDFMPHDGDRTDVVRRVRGMSGTVAMHQDLRIRFAYATAIPWVRQVHGEPSGKLIAAAGPDALVVRGPVLKAAERTHRNRFVVQAGDVVDITLTWYPSYLEAPKPLDVDERLEYTHKWWTGWVSGCTHDGPYRGEVIRSLVLLRALTNEETGGIVAAATTSLPEDFGGDRNWDYRYVWLRDASLTLGVLLAHGFTSAVERWRGWLLRAIAGDPADVQIMYGLAGERNLDETTLASLPGYRGASPVRVGNAAAQQFQSDVIGETMIALHQARQAGLETDKMTWSVQRALVRQLEKTWQHPDRGIWEIRGEPRHFTHSRAMIWAGFDRAIRAIEEYGLSGPIDHWKGLRDQVRSVIDRCAVAPGGWFRQHEDTDEVDASLLQLTQIGFCRADDPRMVATVGQIEATLMHQGLVKRYRTEAGVDGLSGHEHPFLACSFWLVEQYADMGRLDDARGLMDRLVGLTNDVGMLSEEYDPVGKRHVGNTPQALSHLALVRAADAIARANKAAQG